CDLRGGRPVDARARDHDGRARTPCTAARVFGAAQRARGRPAAAALARRPPSLPRAALAPSGFVDGRAVAEGFPPLAVVRVPRASLRDSVLPADLVAPAELLADFRRVEEVAPVVAGPVGDDRLQRLGLPGVLEDGVGDLGDRLLDTRADVVGLAGLPAL